MESINDYQEREPRRADRPSAGGGRPFWAISPSMRASPCCKACRFCPAPPVFTCTGGWEAPFFWRRAGFCWA